MVAWTARSYHIERTQLEGTAGDTMTCINITADQSTYDSVSSCSRPTHSKPRVQLLHVVFNRRRFRRRVYQCKLRNWVIRKRIEFVSRVSRIAEDLPWTQG